MLFGLGGQDHVGLKAQLLQAFADLLQLLFGLSAGLQSALLGLLDLDLADRGDLGAHAGDAASIEENGRAMALVLQMMTEAWLRAGKDAKDIFLIQNLETVLRTVTEKVNAVSIDEINLIDGGDGTALPNYVASYPAMVSRVLRELNDSTGVDVLGILSSGAKPGAPAALITEEVK